MQQRRHALDGLLAALHTTAAQSVETVQRLQADSKRLAREVEQLKMKVALGGGQARSAAKDGDSDPEDDSREVAGIKLVTRRVEGLEKGALRGLSDSLRDRLGSGVVVLASEVDGKVALVVSVSKDLTGRVQAGRMVKELAPIVGGGGGGRPDFAEAGGKDASKIDELLSRAPAVLASLLAA
jgi:alanyl-tRNA synthetase